MYYGKHNLMALPAGAKSDPYTHRRIRLEEHQDHHRRSEPTLDPYQYGRPERGALSRESRG